MIPKLTVSEIMQRIHSKMKSENLSVDGFINKYPISKSEFTSMSKENSIWTSKEYAIASDYLEIPVEELLQMLPKEDLENISFRATENSEEIDEVVKQINEIFEQLTYQVKIKDKYYE